MRRFSSTKVPVIASKTLIQTPQQTTVIVKSNTAPTYATQKAVEDSLQPLKEVRPSWMVSGVPTELLNRKVLIEKPTKSVMQSGPQSEYWTITFMPDRLNTKWENPLMGWTASNDSVQGYRVKFQSVTEAVQFAQKQGWDYQVKEPEYSLMKPKQYADNYKYVARPLRHAKTK